MLVRNELAPQGAVPHLVNQAGREILPREKIKNLLRKGTLALTAVALAACSRFPVSSGEIERETPPPIVEHLLTSPIPTEPFTSTPEPTPGAEVIAEAGLNVRSGPGTVYDREGVLPAGAQVQVLGRTEDGAWVKAVWTDEEGNVHEGWLAADYLQLNEAAAQAPIISPNEIPLTSTPTPTPTETPIPTSTPTPTFTPDTLKPTPTPTEVPVLQILPENREIKGREEVVSLKELEQQGYWLFYYDPDEQIFKRLAYASREYTIDANGYWLYTLVNNPKNEEVRVIKREDGSIIGINNNGDKVEAVAIKDIIDFFGGEDNVSDPIRVSDSYWDYNEVGIRKLALERIDIPGYIDGQSEEIVLSDGKYRLNLVRILVPRFYPERTDDGKIIIVQELWPYWAYYSITNDGKILIGNKIGICKGGCTARESLEVFEEVKKNEKFVKLGITLFTEGYAERLDARYKGLVSDDLLDATKKVVNDGVISIQEEELLAKRALVSEEIGTMGQNQGKDPVTYFAGIYLNREHVSTKRNRGDGVWVSLDFDTPLPLPKPYSVVGLLGQVEIPVNP